MSYQATWADRLIGIFTGETPEKIEAEFMETRKEFFDEYTPEERRQMDTEENNNYIENIKSHPMREVSQSLDDNYQYWQEYVIDRYGNKVIIDSGERYTGYGEMQKFVDSDGDLYDFLYAQYLTEGENE